MFADRIDRISPFRVMELMARAKALEAQGHRVVHFEVGEPDFETAGPIVTAGHQALDAGRTKYTQAQGLPELRRAISSYYGARLGCPVDESRIVVTSGASAGLTMLAGLLLNPFDEVLITDPGYPCNEVFIQLVGADPVRLPVSAEHGYLPLPAQVDASWTDRTKGLLIASPANPTGAMISAAGLRELNSVVVQRQGFLILDEIYQGLVYGSSEFSTGLAVCDDIYVLNSFSKYFGMTGWRLGWLVLPQEAVEGVVKLAQNLYISPSAIAQYAALAAFSDSALQIHEQRRLEFASRRDRLSDGLTELGFTINLQPAGAFYLYVDISHTGMSSVDFCWRLINEFQVAVTPGIDFGDFGAKEHVRFAYTVSGPDIDLGLERIARALKAWA
ncbi:MAG: aminotransferase class I/II-fold pyridoxal phosphate-dependent enzyme [Proteobacteria bacterium]|nr:aminotransferase class I/II-fold pyridoxal phosphate-dependent enzyme [Pseudomonadota bacterium]